MYDTPVCPTMQGLSVEIERDEFAGFHVVIVEIGSDAVLFVSDSYATADAAMRAAQQWIETNG